MEKNKQPKIKSALIFKHGAYNSALVAIVIAAAVIINILATAAANRFPIAIDLSLDRKNTISEENVEYIKDIEKDVEIILCATEEGYTGGYMAQYAQNLYAAQDTTGGYYSQTINLLNLYKKHNPRISVTFADPDANSFTEVQAKAGETALDYGDILVYSKFTAGGDEITNFKVLKFNDIYELTDESGYAEQGYGLYTVSGSKLETALTSALYTVTSEELKKVAFLSGHCYSGAFTELEKNLKLNSFETVDISDTIIESIDEEIDILVIASPKQDFSSSEIELIEKFLENDGKKGKSLAVFCDSNSTDMPNLYAFLEEWGISCLSNTILFETDPSNHLTDEPTILGFVNKETDYTKSVNSADAVYIADANVPMKAAYENYGKRTTTVLLETPETVVAAPLTADANWKPSADYKKQSYANAILTEETKYDEDLNENKSTVVAFSSTDFISSNWTYYDAVGNNSFAVAVFKTIGGAENTDISFVDKTVMSYTFTQPLQNSVTLVRIIFIGVIPLLMVALGVYVWYRRKNR